MPNIKISTSTSGANELVAAVTGRKIRVTNFQLIGASAVSVKFQSGSTDLTGAMLATYGLKDGPGSTGLGSSFPILETAEGEALVLNLSSGVQVSGYLSYELVG